MNVSNQETKPITRKAFPTLSICVLANLLEIRNERNQQKKNPPEWQKYFPRHNIPSWKKFLEKLSTGFTGYDGLTDSLVNKCSPCHYHYRAVIKMETFEEDSK